MLDPQVNPAGPASARYAITPERRALLNTIRFSEGTWARGEDVGYPTLAGNSYYGQPVQRYAVLRSFYERNLAELRAAVVPVQEVAKTPACEPVDSLRCQLESLDRVGPRSLNRGS